MTTLARPEYDIIDHIYPDTGCHIAPRCTACPLIACVFEDPWQAYLARQKARREEELARINELRAAGLSIEKVADAMGIHWRRVYRRLAGT